MVNHETWDLTPLYDSFESEQFLADFKRCEELVQELLQKPDENQSAVQRIANRIKLNEEFHVVLGKTYQFASLTRATDTTNVTANKYIEKLHKLLVDLTPAHVTFQRWVSSLENFDEVISDPQFDQYRFYLKEVYDDAKYLLSDAEEILVAELSQTGSQAWEKLFDDMWSGQMVPITIDGEQKELPLAQVRNFYFSKDPKMRKNAYEAELAAYNKMEVPVAAALNGVKGQVITMAKKRGFSSPLDMTLHSSRMDKEILDAMLNSMKKFLPAFQKYMRHKAKLLGHEGALPFYDVSAPLGSSEKTFSYEFTQDFIVKQFGTFSQKMADFAKNAFEKRWIDLRPREGKLGGGFCSGIHAIKQSRILMNSTDSFDDLTTMAHELGHAYHNLTIDDEPSVNTDYPMPLAETASIFCETIVFNAALNEATNEEKILYLDNYITSCVQVIVDIYSRFLFEDTVFTKRVEHSLDIQTIKDSMVQAQIAAYGDGLDHNTVHPYMWACKPHYYDAGYNYYNFPYAFGLLFAKGLYAQFQEQGTEFVDHYDKILNACGKMTIHDVGKLADVDLSQTDFWESSLQLIANDIDAFIALSSESNN